MSTDGWGLGTIETRRFPDDESQTRIVRFGLIGTDPRATYMRRALNEAVDS